MTLLILVVLASLGTIFLWGLLAPRSQWRALISWSYRDPYVNEPTGLSFVIYRVVSIVGIATMIVSGVLAFQVQNEKLPVVVRAVPTEAELLWGSPAPVVVNRIIEPVRKAPAGLLSQPILGYQDMDGKTRQPPYLFDLAHFAMPEATTENGFIGVDPTGGLVALDSAHLALRVSGDPQCFPHAVFVSETGTTVRVGIFYGRALPDPSSPPDDLADCQTLASSLNVSTIIAVPLIDPLGKRDVVALDGSPIRRVEPLQ